MDERQRDEEQERARTMFAGLAMQALLSDPEHGHLIELAQRAWRVAGIMLDNAPGLSVHERADRNAQTEEPSALAAALLELEEHGLGTIAHERDAMAEAIEELKKRAENAEAAQMIAEGEAAKLREELTELRAASTAEDVQASRDQAEADGMAVAIEEQRAELHQLREEHAEAEDSISNLRAMLEECRGERGQLLEARDTARAQLRTAEEQAATMLRTLAATAAPGGVAEGLRALLAGLKPGEGAQ